MTYSTPTIFCIIAGNKEYAMAARYMGFSDSCCMCSGHGSSRA